MNKKIILLLVLVLLVGSGCSKWDFGKCVFDCNECDENEYCVSQISFSCPYRCSKYNIKLLYDEERHWIDYTEGQHYANWHRVNCSICGGQVWSDGCNHHVCNKYSCSSTMVLCDFDLNNTAFEVEENV